MVMDVELRRRSVTEQAAEWFVRCTRGGELTAQERRALQHWLKAAPEHAVEFARMSMLEARLIGHFKLSKIPPWMM